MEQLKRQRFSVMTEEGDLPHNLHHHGHLHGHHGANAHSRRDPPRHYHHHHPHHHPHGGVPPPPTGCLFQSPPDLDEEEEVSKLWSEYVAMETRRIEIYHQLEHLEGQEGHNPLFASADYRTYKDTMLSELPLAHKRHHYHRRRKSGGSHAPTTRLARRTKSRILVTETIRLATQLTPEAQAGMLAGQQKMLGINKEQLWVVFDALVNSQLPANERISHSSAFKYLFCGLNYLGYKVEPLYGNESLHKTTRKGGGVKRLSGVMWRDLDAPESKDVVRTSLESLQSYGINVDMDKLRLLLQANTEADALAPHSPPMHTETTAPSPTSPPAAAVHQGHPLLHPTSATGSPMMYPPVNVPMALPVAVPATSPGHPARSPLQTDVAPPHHQPPQDEIVAQGTATAETLSADEDLQQLIKLMSKHGMMEKLQLLMQLKKPDH